MKRGCKAWLNKLEGKSDMWAEHYGEEDWLLFDEGMGHMNCSIEKERWRQSWDECQGPKFSEEYKLSESREKGESFFTI